MSLLLAEDGGAVTVVDDGSDWWAGAWKYGAAAALALAISSPPAWAYQPDEVVPQAAAFAPAEDFVQLYVPTIPPPAPLYLPDATDPVAPQPVTFAPVEDFWQPGVTQPARVAALYLPSQDELPTFAPPTLAEEDLWCVYVPPRQGAAPLYLPDPEEVPAGSLRGVPDDYGWAPFVPAPVAARLVVFAQPDELAPAVVGFVPDEDYWQGFEPRVQRPLSWQQFNEQADFSAAPGALIGDVIISTAEPLVQLRTATSLSPARSVHQVVGARTATAVVRTVTPLMPARSVEKP